MKRLLASALVPALAACGLVTGLDDLEYDLELGAGGSSNATSTQSGGGTGAMGGSTSSAASGGSGGMPPSAVTLADHPKGQTSDKLSGTSDLEDAVLFALRLAPIAAQADLVHLEVQGSNATALDDASFADVRLWLDEGGVAGALDPGDLELSIGSVSQGLFSFDPVLLIDQPRDLILTADVTGAAPGAAITLGANAALVGVELGGMPASAEGSVSSVTHARLASDLAPSHARLVYRDGGVLRMRDFDGSGWSGAQGTTAVGADIRFVATPEVLVSDVQVAAVLSGSGSQLDVVRFEAGSWSLDWTVNGVLPGLANKRTVDVACEAGSGIAMVVYAYDDASPVYRMRIGGSWTAEAPVAASPPGSASVEWVELVSRPESNEIALLYSDADAALYAAIWDGASWSSPALLEPALNVISFQNFAAAYEDPSGDLLVVWAHPVAMYDGFFSSTKPAGQTSFTSGLYQTQLTKPGVASLAPERGSDRIAMAHLEHSCGGASCDNLEGGLWTGSAFVDKVVVDGQIEESYGARPGTAPVAVSWIGQSGTAVAVYVSGYSNGPIDWARYTSSGWALQPDAVVSPAIAEPVNVQALDLGTKALFVIADLDGNLWAKTTNGTSWTSTENGAPLGNVSLTTARPLAASHKP